MDNEKLLNNLKQTYNLKDEHRLEFKENHIWFKVNTRSPKDLIELSIKGNIAIGLKPVGVFLSDGGEQLSILYRDTRRKDYRVSFSISVDSNDIERNIRKALEQWFERLGCSPVVENLIVEDEKHEL